MKINAELFFRIARVGVRANSIEELLAGNFHVIEVNIFLPMPLVLLDSQRSWAEKHRFIRESMKGAAPGWPGTGSGLKRDTPFFSVSLLHTTR
ncbi:MAG: hypothetical protein GQ542_11140 [Desulforhopalus sp.]|nr:hypothetical protein [Desulforhopalus sp.]